MNINIFLQIFKHIFITIYHQKNSSKYGHHQYNNQAIINLNCSLMPWKKEQQNLRAWEI